MAKKLWHECHLCGYAIDWFDLSYNKRKCRECYAKEKRIFYKNNTQYCKEKVKLSEDKYPEKRKARIALNWAVASNRVKRLPCEVCGSQNSQGHHTDYAQPLQVKWLCPHHHAMEHKFAFDEKVGSIVYLSK